jgi:ABC-2 type transport system permease protein
MTAAHYARALSGIMRRELLRTLAQHGRLAAALVRPMIWLAVFAAGFRAVLGLSVTPPYQTYVLYEVYIVPGLAAMMLLFHGMQTSLSMVYDREMGSMRTLLIAPLPRWYLLGARLLANVVVALPLVYAFLVLARLWDVRPPSMGYVAVLPALVLAGLMLGALGLFISSFVRQLENFAGVMNFVIFPMFFASSALYPLWRVKESSLLLYQLCLINPFTHAVELIRFALYGQVDWPSLGIVLACTAVFLGAAIYAYNPSKGLIARRGGPGSGV